MSLLWCHIEAMRRTRCVYLVHRHLDTPVEPMGLDEYTRFADAFKYYVFPTFQLAEARRVQLHGRRAASN